MMTRRSLLFAVMLWQPILMSAQTCAPLVTMRVTTPDGTAQEISARESSVAAPTLKDGSAYEFGPTIHDERSARQLDVADRYGRGLSPIGFLSIKTLEG